MDNREDRIFLIHGLKRSGNHAVINWIMRQSSFAFFNNIVPIKPISEGKKALVREHSFNRWLLPRSIKKAIRRLDASVLVNSYIRKSVIISFEDHSIENSYFEHGAEKAINILVLRDPENLFSSRIRKAFSRNWPGVYPRKYDAVMESKMDLWKEHAREALNETDFLANKVVVFFDRWVCDTEYRSQILSKLRLTKQSEDNITDMAHYGGGSSFGSPATESCSY